MEAQGCYILILFHTWNNNCRPYKDDDKIVPKLLRITPKKWRKIKEEITPLFDLSEGTFKQKRLEKAWREALQRSEKAREAAKIRHEKRRMYAGRRLADALPKHY
tara:strand:- start:4266 stop:4580 length:315 start_codon:yes stop_codon:yes gene_type:complete